MRHKTLYHIDEPLIDISVSKVLVIIITVMVFFLIPAQVITIYKTDPKIIEEPISEAISFIANSGKNSTSETSEGRVAGISTSVEATSVDSNTGILNNQSFLIGGMGFFFLLLSLGGLGYLIDLDRKYKKNNF